MYSISILEKEVVVHASVLSPLKTSLPCLPKIRLQLKNNHLSSRTASYVAYSEVSVERGLLLAKFNKLAMTPPGGSHKDYQAINARWNEQYDNVQDYLEWCTLVQTRSFKITFHPVVKVRVLPPKTSPLWMLNVAEKYEALYVYSSIHSFCSCLNVWDSARFLQVEDTGKFIRAAAVQSWNECYDDTVSWEAITDARKHKVTFNNTDSCKIFDSDEAPAAVRSEAKYYNMDDGEERRMRPPQSAAVLQRQRVNRLLDRQQLADCFILYVMNIYSHFFLIDHPEVYR